MRDIKDPVKLQKEVLKRAYILSIIPVVSTIIMGEYSFLLGFLFGLFVSTLLFRLKFLNIKRSIDMSEEGANTFIRNRYFVEYFIYFIVLIVSASNPSLNFLAAAIGLFVLKFTVLAWALIDLFRDSLKKKIDSYKS